MSEWRPDRLLPGFESLELVQPPDYDGPVVATLVRAPAGDAPRAVLYVHGFIDYFFQRHMAERFAAEGYAFYALDLRKHGRSLLPHQHPCYCADVAEYYADIDRALQEIGQPVLLAGHSTGGLICSLYAKEGARKALVQSLWLNSPFFDWRSTGAQRAQLQVARFVGGLTPFLNNPKAVQPQYVKSLHRHWDGEWDFDLKLKPLAGFPAFFGWVRAIFAAQEKVHAGLNLRIPILSMHSDEADIILDWRHIARWSRTLGPRVSVLSFPGAFHDLVLSRSEIREEVFRHIFAWARERSAGGSCAATPGDFPTSGP